MKLSSERRALPARRSSALDSAARARGGRCSIAEVEQFIAARASPTAAPQRRDGYLDGRSRLARCRGKSSRRPGGPIEPVVRPAMPVIDRCRQRDDRQVRSGASRSQRRSDLQWESGATGKADPLSPLLAARGSAPRGARELSRLLMPRPRCRRRRSRSRSVPSSEVSKRKAMIASAPFPRPPRRAARSACAGPRRASSSSPLSSPPRATSASRRSASRRCGDADRSAPKTSPRPRRRCSRAARSSSVDDSILAGHLQRPSARASLSTAIGCGRLGDSPPRMRG